MEEKDLLEKLGIGHKESAVYLSLLGEAPLTIAEIQRRTGLHRPTIYQILPLLLQKGFISRTVRGRQKRYVAESPEKFKRMLDELSLAFEETLPQMKKTHEGKENHPFVRFLEGKAGIRSVFDDIVYSLKRGDVFYRYSSRKSSLGDQKYLSSDYRKLRDQKQLERFVITNEASLKEKKPRLERAIKIVPASFDLFAYDITQLIYGNKVAYVDYHTETACIIENSAIAEFQKKIFQLLYEKL